MTTTTRSRLFGGRFALLLAGALSTGGCLHLPVDEGTEVRCETSDDCPQPITRCRAGLCVRSDANEPAAVSITDVVRGARAARRCG